MNGEEQTVEQDARDIVESIVLHPVNCEVATKIMPLDFEASVKEVDDKSIVIDIRISMPYADLVLQSGVKRS